MVYVVLGVRLERVSDVILPDELLPTAKLPVLISRIVPAGFVLRPRFTVTDVL